MHKDTYGSHARIWQKPHLAKKIRIWPVCFREANPHLANFCVLVFGQIFCCCCCWLLFLVVSCCFLLFPVGACWCLLVPVGACWCLLVPVGACWCLLVLGLLLLGLSPGPPSATLLNFGGVFEDPERSNMRVWALGLSCETTRPGRRGFTRQPENSKRAYLSVPALQTPPKFHERTPRERKK